MEFWHPKHLVGDLAVITTILQFLSGALVCRKFVNNKTTGEYTSLPFIICVPSCALWLLYGIYKGDNKIILVNLVGITLMTIYTVIFYIFTIRKSSVIKECLVISLIFFLVILYVMNEDNADNLLKVLGILASAFTLLTISAPMANLFHVLKVKNTECLPFPMILMSFVVSTLWFLYGFLVYDPFIKIVNVIGAAIAVAQLSLFFVYPSSPPSPVYQKV